jgi:general secretion pathway protein G
MGEVNKRVELYALKKGPPTAEGALEAVYRDQEIPKDAWGNDFVYVPPAGEGLSFDLISYGADGEPGGTRHDADILWSENK